MRQEDWKKDGGDMRGMNGNETESILSVSHLKKSYKDNLVLDDISFRVEKGEVVVVLGPSGSGKSTLLRCMNALEPIDGGEIRISGARMEEGGRDLPLLRRKIGMVFQSYELFPHLDVLSNIMLAPVKVAGRDRSQVKAEALELLARVGLSDKKDSFPRELSGGQKQRAAIVRALAMHPEVLLFDEVTAALDPEMVREVLDVILDLAGQGRTMLIVTHEMQFAEAIADRILFLDGAKIVEETSPELFFHHSETERAKRFLDTFSYRSVKKQRPEADKG